MSALLKQKILGKKHPLLAALAVFVLWIILLGLFSSFINPLLVSALSDNSAWLRFSLEFESLVSIMIATQIGRTLFGNTSSTNSVKQICLAFLAGLLSGFLWFALSFGLLVLFDFVNFTSTSSVSFLLIWVSACFINAIFQETLVRGQIFDWLTEGKGVIFATLTTTIVFTLFHPGAFLMGPIAIIQIVAASIFLTLIRLITRGLSAPIATHAIWNILGGIVFGVVSLADDYPRIIETNLIGPWFISGGSMWLEGSAITLFVTCGLCALMFALMYRMSSNKVGLFRSNHGK